MKLEVVAPSKIGRGCRRLPSSISPEVWGHGHMTLQNYALNYSKPRSLRQHLLCRARLIFIVHHAYLIWPRTHHRNFPDSLSMHVVPMHTSNTAQGTGARRIAMHQLSPAMCAKTHIAHLDHTMKTMVWFHISKLNWLEHVKSAARYGMPLNSSRPLS